MMSQQEVDNPEKKSLLYKLLEAQKHPLLQLSELVLAVFLIGFTFRDKMCTAQFHFFCFNFKATIDNPKNGQEVEVDADNNILVTGTLINLDKLPPYTQLWLVVKTNNSQGVGGYYPQGDEALMPHPSKVNYTWQQKARIGQSEEDKGKNFDIMVVAANNKASTIFRDYIVNCRNNSRDCFNDPPLPEGAEYLNLKMPIIQVIRK
jgi:hypothetical protein